MINGLRIGVRLNINRLLLMDNTGRKNHRNVTNHRCLLWMLLCLLLRSLRLPLLCWCCFAALFVQPRHFLLLGWLQHSWPQ